MKAPLPFILDQFRIATSDYAVTPIGTGHIHQTWRLTPPPSPSSKEGAGGGFILQRINKNVFKQPELIASNLKAASSYLKKTAPGYRFLSVIPSRDGAEMVYEAEGFPWRLFPFIDGTITIDRADTAQESFNAAAGFAELTARLDGVDVGAFAETIPDFQNLAQRYHQFETACAAADGDRKRSAADLIDACRRSHGLVEEHESLIAKGVLRRRIVHNDTKINNILFDRDTRRCVCVIDLDTLMPGYFIYDFGDMVRTFVSPVTEEEKDFSKIRFRREIYDALLDGYLSKMGSVLTPEEKTAIPFAGKMMTYIMALRFLADYLNGDTYYHTTYPGQNLVRAGNQMRLLEVLEEKL